MEEGAARLSLHTDSIVPRSAGRLGLVVVPPGLSDVYSPAMLWGRAEVLGGAGPAGRGQLRGGSGGGP